MTSRLGALIPFGLGWLLVVKIAHAAPQAEAASHGSERAQDFFESTNLVCFEVELDEAAWQGLSQGPKMYVSGKVRVGALCFEQVGVRLNGRGTFQPIT